MEVQTFRAGSMREALMLVKTTLGPDAAVLRTREVQGGVLRRIAGRSYIEITATRGLSTPRSQCSKAPVVERGQLCPDVANGIDLALLETARPGDPDDHPRKLTRLRCGAHPTAAHGICPPLVAVSGGNSGVDTSTIALQLATALDRGGWRPLLVEADSDRGGIVHQNDHSGSIDGRTDLAPGRLLAELQRPMPHVDLAVVDLGSDRNPFVQRFWQAASMVVVVATEAAESMMDAYATIKVLHAGDTSLPIYTLLNLTEATGNDELIHDRIGQTCMRFLGLRTSVLGSLPGFDTPHAEAAFTNLAETLAVELGLPQPIGRELSSASPNRHVRQAFQPDSSQVFQPNVRQAKSLTYPVVDRLPAPVH